MEFILWSGLRRRWKLPEIEKFKGAVAGADGQKFRNNLQLQLCCYWSRKNVRRTSAPLPFTPRLLLKSNLCCRLGDKCCIIPKPQTYSCWQMKSLNTFGICDLRFSECSVTQVVKQIKQTYKWSLSQIFSVVELIQADKANKGSFPFIDWLPA